MRYRIRHTTRYQYPEPVSLCYSLTHLLPRDTDTQRCMQANVLVSPFPFQDANRIDYFGNRTYHYSLQTPHNMLEVEAISEVEVLDQLQSLSLDFGPSCSEVQTGVAELANEENIKAREFALNSFLIKKSDELADYARSSFADDKPFFSCVNELNNRIHADFTYDPKSTEVSTPLSEVLKNRRGVCQDFAHLAIGCLRSLGYCARYVSGYLETLPPPGQEKLEGADASHAWFAAYSPVEGWLDFDPTNNLMASEQHITTAWGRDYADVAPLKGSVLGGGTKHDLAVEVDVQRIEAN